MVNASVLVAGQHATRMYMCYAPSCVYNGDSVVHDDRVVAL